MLHEMPRAGVEPSESTAERIYAMNREIAEHAALLHELRRLYQQSRHELSREYAALKARLAQIPEEDIETETTLRKRMREVQRLYVLASELYDRAQTHYGAEANEQNADVALAERIVQVKAHYRKGRPVRAHTRKIQSAYEVYEVDETGEPYFTATDTDLGDLETLQHEWCSEWLNKATPAQTEALNEYVTLAYRQMNDYMRGRRDDDEVDSEIPGMCRDLQELLEAHELPSPMILYRGFAPERTKIEEVINPGKPYLDPAFVSCSMQPDCALNFSYKDSDNTAICMIYAPKKTRGVTVGVYRRLDLGGDNEHEVILAPGVEFRVLKREPYDDQLEDVLEAKPKEFRPKWFVVLEVVDQKGKVFLSERPAKARGVSERQAAGEEPELSRFVWGDGDLIPIVTE